MRLTKRGKKKLFELGSEFLLDAGVLVFVFPVLDSLVQFGMKALTRSLIAWSIGVALFFLGLALIIGVAAEQMGEAR